MPSAVVDPLVGPDFQNELIGMTAKHYEESLRLLFKNLWPRGYMAGETPYADKLEELLNLVLAHDATLAVALDPNALPGDAARAQQGLFREETLSREMFR